MKSGENVIISNIRFSFFSFLKKKLIILVLVIELNKDSSFDAIVAQRTGLCQDMCCERERLTRESQRLYKSYELDPDSRCV